MVLVPVSPDEASKLQRRRPAYSPGVVKEFLESGVSIARVDQTQLNVPNTQALVVALATHVRSTNAPVRVFQQRGEVYLERTDGETAKDVAEPG